MYEVQRKGVSKLEDREMRVIKTDEAKSREKLNKYMKEFNKGNRIYLIKDIGGGTLNIMRKDTGIWSEMMGNDFDIYLDKKDNDWIIRARNKNSTIKEIRKAVKKWETITRRQCILYEE